jgi:hypothetical protein
VAGTRWRRERSPAITRRGFHSEEREPHGDEELAAPIIGTPGSGSCSGMNFWSRKHEAPAGTCRGFLVHGARSEGRGHSRVSKRESGKSRPRVATIRIVLGYRGLFPPYHLLWKQCTLAHGSSSRLVPRAAQKRRRTEVSASPNWQRWCRRRAQSVFSKLTSVRAVSPRHGRELLEARVLILLDNQWSTR